MQLKDALNTGFNLLLSGYNYSDDNAVILKPDNNLLQLSDYTEAFKKSESRIISGLQCLDRMCGEYEDTEKGEREFKAGFCTKDIIIIGGMSGSGKTTFAFNLFANLHKRQIPTIFFSLDMRVKRAWDSFRNAMVGYMGTSGDFVNELLIWGKIPKLVTIQEIIFVKSIDNFLENNPAQVIFIDYIDQLKPSKICRSDKENFTELFGELKRLAEKHNCTVILLSQTKEDKGYRQGRLTLGSLYGGKEVRSSIDHAWGVYRNFKYNDKLADEFKNVTEIEGIKLRSDNVNENMCYVKFVEGKMIELTPQEKVRYIFALGAKAEK